MSKRPIILFAVLCAAFPLRAQLTLDECQQAARDNYPLVKDCDLIRRSAEYTVQNARRGWLPQVSVGGQAAYQSEVAAFPAGLEAVYAQMGIRFEGLHKDQYKAWAQIDQTVWDGGASRAQVASAEAERDVQAGSWEVGMYTLRERVNSLFFGILQLHAQRRQSDTLLSELRRNLTQIESYVRHGVATASDAEQVEVEILSVTQQQQELDATTRAFRTMLSAMIARPVGGDTELVPPPVPRPAVSVLRPELALFDAQSHRAETQKTALRAGLTPRIGLFVQGAYANPGLNMFEDMLHNRWSGYYIAGVKLSWNIGGFYTKRNNLNQIAIAQDRIENQRAVFLYNTDLTIAQQRSAVQKMLDVMRSDDRIIALRASIKRATQSKVEHGAATVSDLLRDIHLQSEAEQQKALHEIEYLKNLYELKTTTND